MWMRDATESDDQESRRYCARRETEFATAQSDALSKNHIRGTDPATLSPVRWAMEMYRRALAATAVEIEVRVTDGIV